MPNMPRSKSSKKAEASRKSKPEDKAPAPTRPRRSQLAKNFVPEVLTEAEQNRINVQPQPETISKAKPGPTEDKQPSKGISTGTSASVPQGFNPSDSGQFFLRPQQVAKPTETTGKHELCSYLNLVNLQFPEREGNENLHCVSRRSRRVKNNQQKKEKTQLEQNVQEPEQALSSTINRRFKSILTHEFNECVGSNSEVARFNRKSGEVSSTIVRPENDSPEVVSVSTDHVTSDDSNLTFSRPPSSQVLSKPAEKDDIDSDGSSGTSWTFIGDYQVPKIRTRSRTSSYRSEKLALSSAQTTTTKTGATRITESISVSVIQQETSLLASRALLQPTCVDGDDEEVNRQMRQKWIMSLTKKDIQKVSKAKPAPKTTRKKRKGRRKNAKKSQDTKIADQTRKTPAIKERYLRKSKSPNSNAGILEPTEDVVRKRSRLSPATEAAPVKRWISKWSGENQVAISPGDGNSPPSIINIKTDFTPEEIFGIIGVRYVPHKIESPPKTLVSIRDVAVHSSRMDTIANIRYPPAENMTEPNVKPVPCGIVSVRHILDKQDPPHKLHDPLSPKRAIFVNLAADSLHSSSSIDFPGSPSPSPSPVEITNIEHNYCKYDSNANDVTLPMGVVDCEQTKENASPPKDLPIPSDASEPSLDNDNEAAGDHVPSRLTGTEFSLWRRTYARPMKRNRTLVDLQIESEVGVPSANNHSIAIQPTLGNVLYCRYFESYLVVTQEYCVGFWQQSGLGSFLESQSKWISMGCTNRSQFGPDTTLCHTPDSLLYTALSGVAYVELWTKEHRLDSRQLPGCDLFVVVYFRRRGDIDLHKRLFQLTKITGYAENVTHVVLKQQNCIVVGYQSLSGTASVAESTWRLQCFFLSDDYQDITGVRDFMDSPHPINSLHYVEGCDVIMGGGGDVFSVWNSNELVDTIKMPEHVINIACKSDRGFIFILQKQRNSNNLLLMAINAQDLSCKRLQIFRTPREFTNFEDAYIKDGEVIGFFENGRVCWNAESGLRTISVVDPDTKCWASGDWVIYIHSGFVHVKRGWKAVRLMHNMDEHRYTAQGPSRSSDWSRPGTSRDAGNH